MRRCERPVKRAAFSNGPNRLVYFLVHRRLSQLVLGLMALACAARPARAEPEPALPLVRLTEARELFHEGVSHARSQHWELALAAFQAAFGLTPKPSVLFNLAAAQMRCGKLLASTANFRRFVASEDPGISRAQRHTAELLLTRMEQRIPRLRVQIEGLKAGDRVLLDQTRLYPDELGHDMWLDPGVHTVRVDRPRGDQEVRTIAVSEGQVRVLAFRLP
jgi:hypothetical protein